MTRTDTRPRRPDFNILRIGSRYVARTFHTTLEGEYLGVETPYGERSMLLRQANGTTLTIPFPQILHLSAA